MAVSLHYFRGGHQVSSSKATVLFTGQTVLAVFGLLAVLPASAQYPGQVAKSTKDAPELRAVGVLEWTGEASKPKASRLVPITVFDGGELQDGGIYLARPAPMALAGEVEYQLEINGKTIGLFDISGAGRDQGSWVGFGTWKPLPAAKIKSAATDWSKERVDEGNSDQPVLHRKAHPGDKPAGGSDTGAASGSSGGQASASDTDRPTLHKKTSSDDSGTADSNPAPDPDRPTLHKKPSSDDTSSSASSSAPDPDRPTLKPGKSKPAGDIGNVQSLPDVTDPDRPRLKRGKSSGNGAEVLPTMMGLPPDMHQAVAVSDARNQPDHPWSYSWANPEDEAKMKAALEDMARKALGLNPPPAPAPVPKRTASRQKAKPAPSPPPPPAPLGDEQYRVFELAYGSGATLVLTAHTDGPIEQQKFVTLVAQPDLYGNLLVLLKNVTDASHLDVTPRMRLVDAVDALADNRGELLFELRGATQRQFALYRVLRGQAQKLFVSGGGDFSAVDAQ